MRLIEEELINVCQFQHLKLNFTAGVIGIFGPNGAGKSNSMNAAYAALTGDYSRLEGGKGGAIYQHAAPDEPSSIRIVAEHLGQRFEVTRNLRTDRDTYRSGNTVIKKAGEIKSQIEESLGLSRRIINEYMFVRQRTLIDFISDQPAVRAKSLAQLCNTIHAEACWEALGTQIVADTHLAATVEDNSDELRKEIGRTRSKLRSLQKLQDLSQSRLLTPTQKARCEKYLARAARIAELTKEEPKLREQKSAAHKKRKATEASLATLQASVTEQEAELQRLSDIADKARSSLSIYQKLQDLWTRYRAARHELAELKESEPAPVEPGVSAEDMSQIDKELVDLCVEFGHASKLITSFSATGTVACPTCGTPVTQLAGKIAQAKKDYQSLDKQIQKLKQTRNEAVKANDRYAAYSRAQALYDQKLQLKREQLKAFGNVQEPKGDKATWDQQLATYRKQQSLTAKARGDWQSALAAHSEAQADYRRRKHTLAACLKKLERLAVKPETVARAKRMLETNHKRELAIAERNARITIAEEHYNSAVDELKRLRHTIQRSLKARRWLAQLQSVRDVLHRDRLPRRVHRDALRRMLGLISEHLRRFYDPYRITTDEELNFVAQFPNGTVMPASGLSVGQAGVLALSFRFALNSLFASQLDMMVLDEPTEGLDAENVKYLGHALQALSAYTRDAGLQLIMVTHERELADVFDQVITIGKPT